MNRTIAVGQEDTKGPSEKKMCSSKLLMKQDTGDMMMGGGWVGG